MNPNPEDVRRQVVDALEDARDGLLDDERRTALRLLLLENEDARRAYLEFNNLNRLLSTPGSDVPAPDAPAAPPRTTTPRPEMEAPPTARGSWGALLVGLLATCAVVLVMVFGVATEQRTPTFATLVDTKGSTWISNTQPSRIGARLGRGRMHVASGLVTIDFDHGVEVVLEGPADFELLASDRCRLHSGTFVATAREGGEGFAVETPTGVVVDQGTAFGLKADANGTDVEVFSGRVDVATDAAQRPTSQLIEGERVRMTAEGIGEIVPDRGAEPEVPKVGPAPPEVLIITSDSGRGRDGWVQRGTVEKNKTPDDVMLVNRTLPDYKAWERMGVVTFDLGKVDFTRVESASFVLQVAPTGMGYASRIGDSTFGVYGLTDDSRDRWKHTSHRWRKGPWKRANGHPDPGRTLLVGDFELEQGELGTVAIGGDDLLNFLRTDENGLATLLVYRRTRPSELGGFVHGFASSRHSTLRPPTLKLTLKPDD